ncbi:nuclease-related domain-containing protein [Camelliibacillus cellulosilyticus]|uniref:Nuclease-related domain-containing protein n=1 Tax=Camelliibacillus cellulosilyticus TaxID=2174486 RepID=A0ABV9GQS7_9BACL
MFVNERIKPIKLLKSEALLRRLDPDHPKRSKIMDDILGRRAGYHGELEVDYHISLLPEKSYIIYRGLRLEKDRHVVQMDLVIITQYGLLIIEIKNFTGTLFFDKHSGQMLRRYKDIEEGYADPIAQVKRQCYLLKEMLAEIQMKNIPINHLVAIAFPSTILKTNPGNEHIFKTVLHADHLCDRIKEIEKQPAKRLTEKQKDQLTDFFRRHQTPEPVNILESYKISKDELISGVQCPFCKRYPMKYVNGKWICKWCKQQSRTAHEQALLDFSLLLSPTINNFQCRNYLGLTSVKVARTLLKKMKLLPIGKGKGVFYQLPQS